MATQAASAGKFNARAHSGGDHGQISGDQCAGFQSYAAHAGLTVHRSGTRIHCKMNPACLQRRLQHAPRRFIKLLVHNPAIAMHHGHVHAAPGQRIGGFQTEDAAADHHGMTMLACCIQHGVHIVQIAEAKHAG